MADTLVDLILEFERAFCRWLDLEANSRHLQAMEQQMLRALGQVQGKQTSAAFRRWLVALPLAHIFTRQIGLPGHCDSRLLFKIRLRLAFVLVGVSCRHPHASLFHTYGAKPELLRALRIGRSEETPKLLVNYLTRLRARDKPRPTSKASSGDDHPHDREMERPTRIW